MYAIPKRGNGLSYEEISCRERTKGRRLERERGEKKRKKRLKSVRAAGGEKKEGTGDKRDALSERA